MITFLDKSTDFEAFFVFNILMVEANLSVLTFCGVEVLLDSFLYYFIAMLEWPSDFAMIMSILSIFTPSLFSRKEVIPRL